MTNFGFAFNSTNFSDRVLHIEILSSDESKLSDCEGYVSSRMCKRYKLDDGIGDEAAHSDDLEYDDIECSTVVKVETLHISSAILAVNSPFFYKLFVNGMRESHQRHLTLKINAREEAPFMDLLNFIYNNTLSATTTLDLLDVLMVADKFEVASCMRYCSQLLKKLPMSLDSAFFYLELPASSVLMAQAIQPLTDATKQYLALIYKLQEEAMTLTLSDVEFVLRSDDVQVKSEDCVFDFILKWAHAHYPKPEEYRGILTKRLAPLIRFPYMRYWNLKKLLVCPDFEHQEVSELVREALSFKRAGLSYGECTHIANDPATTISNRRFIERIYIYRPVKAMQFKDPQQPRCVVYFDLTKKECANLFPSNRLCSQSFHLGGKGFSLTARCKKDQHFGLFVYMCKGRNTCIIDYEFQVKKKNSSEEFQSKDKANNCTLTMGKYAGKENLFGIQWTDFISDDSDYFIDGNLHLRAELTLKNYRA